MCVADKKETYQQTCGKCKKRFETDEQLRDWCSEECKIKFKTSRCKKCDRAFLSYQKRSFCSEACKRKECIMCNKTYIPKSTESYCSETCKIKKFTHTCKTCETDFYKQQVTARYCSESCRGVYEKTKKYHIVCKHCKNVLLVTDKNRLYCSDVCVEAYRKKAEQKRNKKNQSNELEELVRLKVDVLIDRRQDALTYIGSAVDFNDRMGFTENVKARVIARDDHQCYICHDDTYIEVHHKLPQNLGGGHEEDNLVTLCRRCHRHVETGNRDHAYRKCLQNAQKTYGMQSLVYRDNANQKIKFQYIAEELHRLNNHLIKQGSGELGESLILLDDLLDEVEQYSLR